MKKISSNARKLLTIVLSLILVMTTLFVVTNETNKVSALNGTPNQNVTSELSNVIVNIVSASDGEDTKYVVNNVATKPMYTGVYYAVKINWEINEQVNTGDYFTLDISDEYFSFTNSVTESDLIFGGEVIGKWKIEDNTIKCTFTEECQKYSNVSGFFEADGRLVATTHNNQVIQIGGTDVELNVNPISTGFPHKDEPALTSGGQLLEKYGSHYTNDKYLHWYFNVNYENAIKFATGQTATNVTNAILRDELEEDMVIEKVTINTPINHPKSETQFAAKIAVRASVQGQFTEINQGSLTLTEWENQITATKKSYGVSSNGKIFLANLGDLPGSFTLADNATDFKALLKSYNGLLTDDELEAMANLSYDSITGTFPIHALNISLKVKSSNANGVFSKTSYDNSATLVADNSLSKQSACRLSVENANAGIEGTAVQKAVLTKKDFDTSEVIPGASFKLQYLDGKTWKDYTATGSETIIRTTDSNGQVTFNDLPEGEYKFVETQAAVGYDITSVVYTEDSFVVTSSDTVAHEITATNKSLPINISGSKTWDDNNNAANKRPNSIIVKLMNGDTVVASKTVTEADNWEYTFDNLPKYDASHNLINYTITEDAVENYNTTVTGYDITNTYIPPETKSSETESSETKPKESTSQETTSTETTTEKPTTEEPTSEESTPEEPTFEEPTEDNEEETTKKDTSVESEKDEFDGELDESTKSTESDSVAPVGTGDDTNGIIWLILTGLCACIIATFSCAKRKEHLDE